jgi:copper resistance protein C
MDRREFIAAAGSATTMVASTSQAFARFRGGAFLDHAVPGVGLTVSGPVRQLRLYFTREVLTAFSSVQITSSTGAVIVTSKPVNDPSDQSIMTVSLGHALKPGTYLVSWHVVSFYERSTSGTFHFTVS